MKKREVIRHLFMNLTTMIIPHQIGPASLLNPSSVMGGLISRSMPRSEHLPMQQAMIDVTYGATGQSYEHPSYYYDDDNDEYGHAIDAATGSMITITATTIEVDDDDDVSSVSELFFPSPL